MPIIYVSGDPLLTGAQFLAFGHNSRGRTELGALESAAMQRYPAAFSAYQKQCRRERIKTGTYWLWPESTPSLMFLAVRESSVGAVRLRFAQSVMLTLARDYGRENIHSLAIAPLGSKQEWPEIKKVIEQWLGQSALSVVVYEEYLPGVRADEG